MARDAASVHAEYSLDAQDEEDAKTASAIQAALIARANGSSLEPAKWQEATKNLKMYHGTSWTNAQHILKEGFNVSPDGRLGRGVYVARRDKAFGFAQSRDRHGGDAGGLVTAIVTFAFPKFVSGDDKDWQVEGHDACRTDYTTLSTEMEWCLKEASQLTVVGIERVPLVAGDDAGVLHLEASQLAASRPPSAGSHALHTHWTCSCGATNNLMWRPCAECNKPKPLEAIGAALSLAQRELSLPHSVALAERYDDRRVAFRVGALGGWAVAMDDAHNGAAHPAAFGETSLMLPAPAAKRAFVDRSFQFNRALDSIAQQQDARRMPPPPPRPAGHKRPSGYFDVAHGERESMAPKRRREQDEESERSASHSQSNASTLYDSRHSRQRREQRHIARKQMREARKYGTCRSVGSRWEFYFRGLTLITDMTKRYAVTAYEGVGSAHRDLLAGIVNLDEEWFDLEAAYMEDAPPTPSARGSTPRDETASSRSRSRSQSTGRGESPTSRGYVGASAGVGYGPGLGGTLGTIREHGATDGDDVLEVLKTRARVINDIVLCDDARSAGCLWSCPECGLDTNVAWERCVQCFAPYPKDLVHTAKESARRVLNTPSHLGIANKENPHRLGVLSGYGLGRYKAVKEQMDEYPAAFGAVEAGALPPPPPIDECSLPDQRLLAITVSEGQAAWPDEADDE